MENAFEHLLSAPIPAASSGDLTAWFDRMEACPFERPIDRALWTGFEADRLGFAFVGGYWAALVRLFALAAEDARSAGGQPQASPRAQMREENLVGGEWAQAFAKRRLSLAATESGGAHPKAIETKLLERDGVLFLNGEKTYATLASVCEEMLVVASRGQGPDGKNRLAVVRVRPDAKGVVITNRNATPFAPEIPHARVQLTDVAVEPSDVLPGDGYTVWLKPFRTIEDTHVLAAALGHVIRMARAFHFDRVLVEGTFAAVLGLHHVAQMEPLDPKAHIALAGLFHGMRRLLSDHDAEWDAKADAETRDRWRRDQGLLVVAEMARSKRTEAAWKSLAMASRTLTFS